MTKTIVASVPSVTADATYYYYACVTAADGETATGDNCADPAEVLVYPSTFSADPKPPYEDCYTAPVRRTPMAGDALLVEDIAQQYVFNCGTITLGGLETIDGVRGFIMSGHVAAESAQSDISSDATDVFIGHSETENRVLRHLLGKLTKMPSTRTEGGKKILSVDAAFVKYPNPQTPICSLTWQRDGESFCLDDTNQNDCIDRISPLTIRGRNGDTYKVVGSQRPTKGLKVTYSGAVTGPGKRTSSVGDKLLIFHGEKRGLYQYAYTMPELGPINGDSGSPIYTTPDKNKNVYIVGVHHGVFSSDKLGRRMAFSSWDEVAEELNLKPISP